MRFLMINCSKYAQQCQNGIFEKMCRATTVPDSVMWLTPRYYVNILSMGNPLIPDAGEFKNRYVKANINLWLIKIIVNISLKLICKEKM